MTEAKDWNEAHFNGHHARTTADFIWEEEAESADCDTRTANKPDMSLLKRNQIPAPRFPLEVLGPAADWVKATAESKCAPTDFVALGLIVSTAGVIGPKRRVSPWEGWEEPSIVWGAGVGPPSFSKSPAFDPFREAVRTVERGLNADWDSKLSKFETDKNAADAHRAKWEQEVATAVRSNTDVPLMPEEAAQPEKPTQRRLCVVDSTPEKLVRLLADNPGGLICYRDELTGLIGSFDKYGGSGADRAFWLEAYGGRSYRYDRVKDNAAIDLPFCAVSLLGGIQPDRLNRFILSGDDDGLASRLLYAWPDPVPSRRPSRAADQFALLAALQRLAALEFVPADGDSVKPRVVLLETDAADEFQAWWERTQWNAKQTATGRVAGAIGKLDGITLRLSQVLEFLAWAWRQSNTPEPEKISVSSVLNAIKLIELWVRPTLERVFSEAALPQVQQDAMVIARWLLKERRDLINARDLRRLAGFPGPKDAKKLDAALELLVDGRWLFPQPNDGPGRPRKDFQVSQAIYRN